MNSWKERAWRIIFKSDSAAGRTYDITLLWLILLSVLVVMLESVDSLRQAYQGLLWSLEWIFTILFTIDYVVRILVVRNKLKYVFSFYGLVDLISVLPTYVALFMPGMQSLMIIRELRLLRMFRILKMARHTEEANMLLRAMVASRAKIFVFLLGVLSLVCILGTLMYLIEGEINPGFANIPQAIYWGIVTITTVGYGDVAPITVMGKMLASIMMLSGFAIIAVPTGIITAEIRREMTADRKDNRRCGECGLTGHDDRAVFCHHCGGKL
ncbi:ion transporter [soil metagenome]